MKANVKELALKTADAYSADRYGKYWVKCADLLLKAGFTPDEAERQLRSKNMRWAADGADNGTQSAMFISFAAMLAKDYAAMKKEAAQWAIEANHA